MKSISLNKEISVDLLKLIDSKLLIQANSGGGKSWAIRRIVEQAFGKVQIIMIDTEGEFANLRKDNEFVLVGKGADAPADVRSAELLARKLLELHASAIIDLYELLPRDRRQFVKLFFQALVNAPKELWPINHGDCLVILDEAHIFAPEKGESEALEAVTSMSSLGRKRGLGLILATQRIAKLNKDAASECNNKLIGRASLDIDRKRAAEEIGFASKEDIISLRNLEPGEFYAFGPAISRDVIKTRVGEISAKPPGRGVGSKSIPAPTEKVKNILAKLADLPQEAAKEAKTVQELKVEISDLKRQNTGLLKNPFQKDMDPKLIDKAIVERDRQWKDVIDNVKKQFDMNVVFTNALVKDVMKIKDLASRVSTFKPSVIEQHLVPMKYSITKDRPVKEELIITNFHVPQKAIRDNFPTSSELPENQVKFGAGERKVLTAIVQHAQGVTRQQLTVLTGYKRSSRDTYLQRLGAAGYISFTNDGRIVSTAEGESVAGPVDQLPTGHDLRAYHLRTLPLGESKILEILMAAYPSEMYRDLISEETGYKRSSRDTYIQRLIARELVTTGNPGMIKASDHLF